MEVKVNKERDVKLFIGELRRLRQDMIDYMNDNILQEYKEAPLVVQNMNWLEKYSQMEIDGLEDAMNDFLRKKYNIHHEALEEW